MSDECQSVAKDAFWLTATQRKNHLLIKNLYKFMIALGIGPRPAFIMKRPIGSFDHKRLTIWMRKASDGISSELIVCGLRRCRHHHHCLIQTKNTISVGWWLFRRSIAVFRVQIKTHLFYLNKCYSISCFQCQDDGRSNEKTTTNKRKYHRRAVIVEPNRAASYREQTIFRMFSAGRRGVGVSVAMLHETIAVGLFSRIHEMKFSFWFENGRFFVDLIEDLFGKIAWMDLWVALRRVQMTGISHQDAQTIPFKSSGD